MLDAFIIEELRRRERERMKKEDARRPRLELPLDPDQALPEDEEGEPKKPVSSTVVVIDL